MLTENNYSNYKRIKYQEAVFCAVTRWKPDFISEEDWDDNFVYLIELSPSEALLNDYNNEKITWEEYVPRFLVEMDNPVSRATILKIAKLASSKTVILFCFCGKKKGNHCHRFLLIDLIQEAAKEAGITISVQTGLLSTL